MGQGPVKCASVRHGGAVGASADPRGAWVWPFLMLLMVVAFSVPVAALPLPVAPSSSHRDVPLLPGPGIPVGPTQHALTSRCFRCCPCARPCCRLHNPLQRQERLSTGWFGVICSFDGVLVEDTQHAHARAWLQVAEEMHLPRPLGQTLNRIKGARDEVVSVFLSVPGGE